MHTINWKITNIYALTIEEQNIIRNCPPEKSKDWTKEEYKTLKDNIRQHLYKEQFKRCAFCRLRINTSQVYDHLEHLVNKAKYLNFMFEPTNIAVACPKCNFDKGIENVLSIPTVPLLVYPTLSSEFIIIHPYFDFYFDHIELLDNVLINAKNNSTKGINTIKLYKLDRLDLTEDRAFELKLSEQDLTKRLILRLVKENDPILLQRIQTTIDRIPNMVLE